MMLLWRWFLRFNSYQSCALQSPSMSWQSFTFLRRSQILREQYVVALPVIVIIT